VPPGQQRDIIQTYIGKMGLGGFETLEKVQSEQARALDLEQQLQHVAAGQVQRLATFVAGDIPTAIAKLDKMVDTLDAYVNRAPTAGEVTMTNLPAAGVEESQSTSEETRKD